MIQLILQLIIIVIILIVSQQYTYNINDNIYKNYSNLENTYLLSSL